MEKQQGGLLVEVLVSMAIGIFLMFGALDILLTSRQNYTFRNAISSVEKDGHLAMELLASDIRMAGFRGCAATEKEIGIGSTIGGYYQRAVLDPGLGIRGWEYISTARNALLNYVTFTPVDGFNGSSWTTGGVGVTPSNNTTVGKDSVSSTSVNFSIARESDVLRLWTVEHAVMQINSATSTTLSAEPSTMVGFPNGSRPEDSRLLLISDCSRSVIVKATQFDHSTGQIVLGDAIPAVTQFLAAMHNPTASVVRMVQYSIESPDNTSRVSLFRRNMNAAGDFGNRVEVIPNVVNMQFLYGESLNGNVNADTYITATEVSDWRNVVSVRIWLFVESERDRVVQQPVTTSYYGHSYTGVDLRMRRGFVKTVTLRNRALGEQD